MRKHHVRFGGGLLEKCRRQVVTRQKPTLRLYDKETARTAGLETDGSRASNGHGSNGNGHSEKPAAPKPSPAQTAVPQYRDGVPVEASNAAEMEAFAAFQSAHQGLAPASREVLRAWAASRNGKS